MNLFREFKNLVTEFEKNHLEYALCGGLAMAVYAFPRATMDIDILIQKESLEEAKTVARAQGFSIDAGLITFKSGAIQIYRMTKITSDTHDALPLDMLLLTPETEQVWTSRKRLSWDSGELSVVSLKGLIKLKSMRLSGQDKDDIMHLERILNES